MIICLSQSNIDAHFYETKFNQAFFLKKNKFVNFIYKKSISEINTPELINARGIICLNSVPKKEIKKLNNDIRRLKKNTLIFHSKNHNFNSKNLIKFDYLDSDLIVNYLKESDVPQLSKNKYIPYHNNLLSVIKNSKYYNEIENILYVKKNMKFDSIAIEDKFDEEHFYIDKKDYHSFAKVFQKAFLSRVNYVRSHQTQLDILQDIQEKINELDISFPASAIDQTNLLIKNIMEKAPQINDDKLSMVLNGFLKKESFVAEHSLILAYLCNFILKKNQMFQNNSKIIEKLILASLLHDISLPKDYQKEKFETDQSDQFLMHTVESSKVVSKIFPDEDLEKIIFHHHEAPLSGLLSLKKTKLSYLSLLFNTLHRYTELIYNGVSHAHVIDEMNKEGYSIEPFNKYFKLLKNLKAS